MEISFLICGPLDSQYQLHLVKKLNPWQLINQILNPKYERLVTLKHIISHGFTPDNFLLLNNDVSELTKNYRLKNSLKTSPKNYPKPRDNQFAVNHMRKMYREDSAI